MRGGVAASPDRAGVGKTPLHAHYSLPLTHGNRWSVLGPCSSALFSTSQKWICRVQPSRFLSPGVTGRGSFVMWFVPVPEEVPVLGKAHPTLFFYSPGEEHGGLSGVRKLWNCKHSRLGVCVSTGFYFTRVRIYTRDSLEWWVCLTFKELSAVYHRGRGRVGSNTWEIWFSILSRTWRVGVFAF